MILNKANPETIQTLSTLMADGAVVVLPCDTIYGLCAIYGIGEKPLKEIKGRDAAKPFLVLATKEQAKKLAGKIPQKILDGWPAPFTAILEKEDGSTIGIRVPDDPFLQKLLEKLGSPVYSTSVNMSGEPTLVDFHSICNRFEALVDCLVRGPEIQGKVASTIIDATKRPFKVIRQGLYNAENLTV
ncbi:MAG: L-threonylcarbamoyladenylate synthase [Sphaerochaetaceae bacterium]|nr:L-threonylcarbamoyladenylate synthase [Sphaerochaetaceae bacterium]